MTTEPKITYLYINTDKGKKRIAVCRISKEHFANMIEDQINKCLNSEAPLGALAIIYCAIDCMSGENKVSDWIDKYLPYVPEDLSGQDFWGARNGLLHSLDIHDARRDKKGANYRPLLFHLYEDLDKDMLIISPDWTDEEFLLDRGTKILSLDHFANAFIMGMKKWVEGPDVLRRLVYPILY